MENVIYRPMNVSVRKTNNMIIVPNLRDVKIIMNAIMVIAITMETAYAMQIILD